MEGGGYSGNWAHVPYVLAASPGCAVSSGVWPSEAANYQCLFTSSAVWTRNNVLPSTFVVPFWYLRWVEFWDVNPQSRTYCNFVDQNNHGFSFLMELITHPVYSVSCYLERKLMQEILLFLWYFYLSFLGLLFFILVEFFLSCFFGVFFCGCVLWKHFLDWT